MPGNVLSTYLDKTRRLERDNWIVVDQLSYIIITRVLVIVTLSRKRCMNT